MPPKPKTDVPSDRRFWYWLAAAAAGSVAGAVTFHYLSHYDPISQFRKGARG